MRYAPSRVIISSNPFSTDGEPLPAPKVDPACHPYKGHRGDISRCQSSAMCLTTTCRLSFPAPAEQPGSMIMCLSDLYLQSATPSLLLSPVTHAYRWLLRGDMHRKASSRTYYAQEHILQQHLYRCTRATFLPQNEISVQVF